MSSTEVPREVWRASDLSVRAGPRPVDAHALMRVRCRLQSSQDSPWLHGEVARRMADRLTLIKARPTLVIDWQAHVGGSRDALRAVYPSARLARVEMPTDLAASHRERRGWHGLLTAVRRLVGAADEPVGIEEVDPGQAGLLWANMVLHGHADPLSLIASWHRALHVDGCLMFSTFGPGTLAELRALYEQAGWGPPMAPLVDMHDLGDMLVEAGFSDPVMDQEQIVLTWSDAAAALRELRALGGNADPRRHAGCRTPRWRRRLEEALNALTANRPDGRLALSFEIAYGHAFKSAPRLNVAPETRVGLEQMRRMLRTAPGREP